MRQWTKTVILGAVSTALIVAIYVTPSPEPGFAGAIFAYNITFFFPLVLLSFICWAAALALYIAFLRGRTHRTAFRIALPFVLLLACPRQLAIIARVLLTPLPSPLG
jgi:hypothetical protein